MIFSALKSFETPLMSTMLMIKASCSHELLERAFILAQSVEQKLSAYEPNSDIVMINKYAGVKAVAVNRVTLEAVNIALEIAEATQGLYDPTIGALSHFGYGFGWREQRNLSVRERLEHAAFVDYKKLIVEGNTVMLKDKGMALDLGGIGKGYAVDKIVQLFKSEGVKKALVSLGGEVYGYGKAWKVAVAHPRKKGVLGLISCDLEGMGVTTSGDYERYIGDYEHHHILNVKSGASANLLASLTLVSATLDMARMDALNTALFQISTEEQEGFLARYGLTYVAVDKALNLSLSEPLKKQYRPL